ncbi:mannonate dehydratase [Mucilaginibacter sp.]|uniref:mannonate dehydratase n=1 Tax=Mucilaginibacter sp. TaxID=1882438 RepID=UPI003266434F
MIPDLEQTFRWFGPADPVTLQAIGQTGATGIVSALHHIPCGEVWSAAEIKTYRADINAAGFNWAVVESVNIHEAIKTGAAERDKYIERYVATLANLGSAGINTVCYNFMPVLDWTRTHLDHRLVNNASALRYDAIALATFDLYILERAGAYEEFSASQQIVAKQYLDGLSIDEITLLTNTVLAGLPGTDEVFTIAEFKAHLKRYSDVDAAKLKDNLTYFLKAIVPRAEEYGIKMCVHPDDPPFPILGLPRVVSTGQDLQDVVDAYPSPSNGITLCTGSLGARGDNDIPAIISRLGSHIHFLHLRNVLREADGSFYEAEHLSGSTNMFEVMKAVVAEQAKRQSVGRTDIAIPMRPDHGHKILDDYNYNTYPGYSVIGRLKGLAELRGLEMGVKRALFY